MSTDEVPREPDPNEDKFKEIVRETNAQINELTGSLMDAHHENIQQFRDGIHQIRRLQITYNHITGQMIDAMVEGAYKMTQLYGDAILAEFGAEVTDPDEEEEEGEDAEPES